LAGWFGGNDLRFPLFLRGILENTVFWVWFFDGENVVDCVVNVVRSQRVFEARKIRHGFWKYFLGIGTLRGEEEC
jgi:hypothetical protein